MGQGGSTEFKELFRSTMSELSQVQLAEIGNKFNELYKQAGGKRGQVIDREAFSNYFNLPMALGDRLFDAFDKKKTGSIDFEEFVCGLSVVLHGSFHDKCRLLFDLFNVSGDEGVGRVELFSLLSAVVSSTSTILLAVTEGGGGVNTPISDTEDAINSIVDAAFQNCDITQSGKLLPLEFEYWLRRNPEVLNVLLPSVVSNTSEDQNNTDGNTVFMLAELLAMGDDDDDADDTNVEEDVTVDEENENDEEYKTGVIEPPPSPDNQSLTYKYLHSCHDDLLTEDTSIDNKESDEPSTTAVEDGKIEQEQLMSENQKPRTLSASEKTLQLARQLSKDIHDTLSSPGSDELHSLVAKIDEDTSEVDESILSAWIPSNRVQSMLASGRKVAPEYLTLPGLLSLTGKCDPVGDMLAATFPGSERKLQLSADQVKMDEEGLHNLLHSGCYHAALNLTSLFLSAHGQGIGQVGQMTIHTHKTLQMWWARFSLLCHLERYNEASQELEAFKDFDQPDLYYQYNKLNYPGQIGCMVPFQMRLIHAQLPMHLNKPQMCLNRLCLLQYLTDNVLKYIQHHHMLPLSNVQLTSEQLVLAEEVWLKRLAKVKCIIGNYFLRMKDYLLARKVYEEVMSLLPNLKPQMLSHLGKICLLFGDVSQAEEYFNQLDLLSLKCELLLPLVHSNRGLVNIYRNQWSEAENNFKSASTLDATPTKSLYNSAMCALYQGRLQEAIMKIEEVIKSSPASLQAALFKTLFFLYDLESTQAQAKKLSWLPLLGYHAPEGFNMMSVGIITQ